MLFCVQSDLFDFCPIEKPVNYLDQHQITKESKTPGAVPSLPKSCRPLTHQVAGHRYGKGRLGIGTKL